MKPYDIDSLQSLCLQTRRDIIRMVYGTASGHPGGALGTTELLIGLYHVIMKHQPHNFNYSGDNEDVFYLSNGHICAVLYSTLARIGAFPIAELSTHRKINSRLQGHPATAKHLEGIRVATGSLGQGLSVAVGHAFAKKMNGDTSKVFVLMGDGEQQEGQIWEASMFAAHHKLDRLIGIIDYNHAQIDGMIEDIMNLGDIKSKWQAFGWKVLEIQNGNDLQSVIDGMSEAVNATGNEQPVLVLLHTIMGYGVDFMQGGNAWHGKAPNTEQYEKALLQLPETAWGDY